MALQPLLSIGELSRRTGLSVSAIRFYEARGLVKAVRTAGNQRRFARADLRRLSFALIGQKLGLTLAEVASELASLPLGRAPTRADWQTISNRIRSTLQQRIAMLERTRDLLDGCIGCGCLSLDRCALYNPGDYAAQAGAGPRFLLGDRPRPVAASAASSRGSAATVRASRAIPSSAAAPSPDRRSARARSPAAAGPRLRGRR
jgi:MerR family redox-sensitive transcriptional activator SoxR